MTHEVDPSGAEARNADEPSGAHVAGLGSALARVAASLLGASLAGLLAAGADVGWARSAAEQPPGAAASWLACVGLVAPVALAVGLGVGAASVLLHPAEPPGLRSLRRFATVGTEAERAERAALLLLMPLGVVAFILLGAHAALAGLRAEAGPRASGVGVGLGAAAMAAVLGVVGLGGARALAARARARLPGPLVAAGIGLGLAVAILAVVIATGTVSWSEKISVLVRGSTRLRR